MLIVMHRDATVSEIDAVIDYLNERGHEAVRLPGANRTAIGVINNASAVSNDYVLRMPGVVDVIRVTGRQKYSSREFYPEPTVVRVGDVAISQAHDPIIIAGPCSVESEAQIHAVAETLVDCGIQIMRGGLFKPRTSPYDFQGLGLAGMKTFQIARDQYNLKLCAEIVSTDDIDFYESEIDIIQVGARNMQNFELLKSLSRMETPVLLKRGMSATVEEWLSAAEYLMVDGKRNIILCERGIRTFETSTRNTLDLNSVAYVRQRTHLPVIVDPSHASGRHELVTPLAAAAIAVGADGLLVEVHPDPSKALSDQNQQLRPHEFRALTQHVHELTNIRFNREADVISV